MSHVHPVLEGTDEWHLLRHIHPKVKELFPSPPKDLKQSDSDGLTLAAGGDTISKRLSAALKASGPTSHVCVICDAEGKDASLRWAALKPVLLTAGFFNLPDSFPAEGLVVSQQGRKTVGVWIMPSNAKPGMIEDFYLSAIPPSDWKLARSQTFIDGILAEDLQPKPNRPKAIYRTWLALHPEPPGPAEAISRGDLSKSEGDIPRFLSWLSRFLDLDLGALPPS